MKKTIANRKKIEVLLQHARRLAIEYRQLTGRPLGITGEIAEFEAAMILGLSLADVRQSGYDLVRVTKGKTEKLQVKGRCVQGKHVGRLGSIDTTKKWDSVLLVLLGPDLKPVSIHEARRKAVVKALDEPGSKARNERRALSISKFKSISTLIWPA